MKPGHPVNLDLKAQTIVDEDWYNLRRILYSLLEPKTTTELHISNYIIQANPRTIRGLKMIQREHLRNQVNLTWGLWSMLRRELKKASLKGDYSEIESENYLYRNDEDPPPPWRATI
jgi:hypothetical protein